MQTDARKQRWEFFRRIDDLRDTEGLLALQVEIADAIRATEAQLLAAPNDPRALSFQIERLRLYADGLVWRTLHPHSIRQLAKNPGPHHNLLEQGDAFDSVLAHAEIYLEDTGLPLLIADITNVIKIGDIILVIDPERPAIIECKTKLPKPVHLMQGRIGRQVSRALGTMQYLREGAAKVYGEEHPRAVVESQHKAERNWAQIELLCADALRDGLAFQELARGDYVWGLRPDRRDAAIVQLAGKAKNAGNAQFGTVQGLMNFEDGLYAPPSAWPISPDVRFSLLEGDVDLYHLVSYESLQGDFGDGRSIEVGEGAYPIVVTVGHKQYPLSRRFIYDIVYGFETVDSCVRGLLQFAEELSTSSPPVLPEARDVKPSVWHIESLQEVRSFLKRDDVADTDLVALRRELLDDMSGDGSYQKAEGGLVVMRAGAFRAVAERKARSKGAGL